ncbi:MAG TPA: FAD-dependent oxidoreductase [Acidimicrobiia bacterium]|nr:FAD-dependent oxidoreductase [Acidimicrobiia bacterium]
MDERFDVVVVGAGLAGLAAGATAAAKGASTLIVDGHQPGGRASTDERGRYKFNRGAHALYRGGEATAVLARLGVSYSGAVPPTGARGRLGNRVDVLPADFRTMLRTRLLSVRGKVALTRFLSGVKQWRPADVAGLTIGQWLDSFKLPPDARAVAQFLVRTTTYVNDEHTVSADVAASQIQMALTNNVLYLDDGWASLIDGLTAAARRNGASVRTGAAVTSVRRLSPDADVTVTLSGGQEIRAGAVVLASGTPGGAASLLGGERPAAWEQLGPEVEASMLDLGLRRGLERPVLFGIDRPLYLVDHARSAKRLAPEGGGLVHVLHYLPLGDKTPASDLRAGLEEHARLGGVEPSMIEEQRFLLRMTVVGAVTTPASGGLTGRPGVDSTGVPGVFVAGDWVGPRGWLADASLSSGEAAGSAAAGAAARQADGVRSLRTRQDVA